MTYGFWQPPRLRAPGISFTLELTALSVARDPKGLQPVEVGHAAQGLCVSLAYGLTEARITHFCQGPGILAHGLMLVGTLSQALLKPTKARLIPLGTLLRNPSPIFPQYPTAVNDAG